MCIPSIHKCNEILKILGKSNKFQKSPKKTQEKTLEKNQTKKNKKTKHKIRRETINPLGMVSTKII